MRLIIIFTAFLYGCSCTEEHSLISPTKLVQLAKQADSTVYIVPIPSEEPKRRVLCRNYNSYGSGCVPRFGMRLKVGLVDLIAVRFESTAQAAYVAKNIDQWYTHNWLLDNVTGEPTLEEFVQRAFNAKRGFKGKKASLRREKPAQSGSASGANR